EPTNGLDPQGIAEVRELIVNVAAQGKTIIMASHILDEVQKVCTHFAVLKKGKKIYESSVKEAMAQKQQVEIAADDMESLKSALEEFDHISEIKNEGDLLSIKLSNTTGTTELNRFLIEKGIVLSHLAERKSSLEQKFLKILEASHD